MSKLKKKKGSSLLTVIAMMAMISILMISILAMTTSGYKLRVDSNKRVESFYGADSGLEISEKILYDYLDAAIQYGNDVVNDSFSTEGINIKEKEFKKAFNKFIVEGGEVKNKPFYDNPVEINGKYRFDDLKKEISKVQYYKKLNRDDITIQGLKLLCTIDRKNYNEITLVDNLDDISGFKLEVESKYTKDSKERVVGVTFRIETPDYGKKLVMDGQEGVPRPLNYIISMDGDFTMETLGSTHVLGDMWVGGNKVTPTNKENKYKGGITITGKGGVPDVKWLGTIATPATLKLENIDFKVADTAEINGNIESVYAGNVVYDYNGNAAGIQNTESIGIMTDVYVYNDFVMNGKGNNIKVKNFYGLNDINYFENNIKNGLTESERSSSMIINSKDFGVTSSLSVEDDTYLLGTSYLDVGSDYQTGHSNVINQITSAYTYRDDEYQANYIYDYMGNVHIINGKFNDSEEFKLKQKIELAENHTTDKLTDIEKKMASGMKSKNIYSVGAVFANGGVQKSNIPQMVIQNGNNVSFDKIVKEKQSKYVKEVFAMGDGKDNQYSSSDFWGNKEFIDVESSFDWEAMRSVIKEIESNPSKYPELVKKNANKQDFIHVTPTKTVDQIMGIAYKEKKHPLSTYGNVVGGYIGSTKVNIILNASGKDLVLTNNKDKKTGFINSEDEMKINYNLKEEVDGFITPLIVISNGNIIINEFWGNQYLSLITSKEGKVSVPNLPGNLIFGNYTTQSQENDIGYPVGERNLINELFKYILYTDEILGDIGHSISKSTSEKEVGQSIEISDLIKTEKWKFIK